MAEMSLLQEFLVREVAEWEDDDVARARFKAFTGQKQDWEERMSFWKDLIVKASRHLNLVIIDTREVQQNWFVRDGVVPMGLQHVLFEMSKSGELESVEQLLGFRPSKLEKVGSFLKKAIIWAGLTVMGESPHSETHVENRLVVRTLLQEQTACFIKSLADSHYSSSCLATLSKIKELCGGAETAELVIRHLVLQSKACFITVESKDNIEGFKISLNENPVAAVSEGDRHLLQLQWTMEMLQMRLVTLDSRIGLTRKEAIKAVKAGEKREAIRRVRNMKRLQLSREQCAGFMDKIEQVLAVIADAETSKKVSDAIQVGNAAIKEHQVTLEDVHNCLSDLDEAITTQRETEDLLAGAPLSSVDLDAVAFEEELALLEEEMQNENGSHQQLDSLAEVPKVPVKLQESQKPTDAQEIKVKPPEVDEEDLDKVFAKLALELA